MNNYNYVYNLSYKEVANMDDELMEKLKYDAMYGIVNQILSDPKNAELPLDRAYRIQLQFLNDMDIVAKCDEIPIHDVVLKLPEEFNVGSNWSSNRKLNIKERLKVLLKGRL